MGQSRKFYLVLQGELRNKLWENRTSKKLFNIEICANDMEQAYKMMWQTYIDDNKGA